MLYTIIINIIGDGMVDTIPSSSFQNTLTQLSVKENTSISLVAIPSSGFKFDSWDNCSITNNNVCCMKVLSDIEITAKFVPISFYNLKINIIGSGSIIHNSGEIFCTETCTKTVQENFCLLLLAIPDSGYVLDSLTGCDICEDLQCVVNIHQDREITVIFVKSYILVVNVRGFGTVVDLVNEIFSYK